MDDTLDKPSRHLNTNYVRETISLPPEGFANLNRWARLTNQRARSGPNFGEHSWRSGLHRFAMLWLPKIIEQLEAAGVSEGGELADDWSVIPLTIDLSDWDDSVV